MKERSVALHTRWRLVPIAFAVELVVGQLYAWSVFVLPLEAEFGWKRAQTSLAFTVSLIFFPLGMFAAGRVSDGRGMRAAGILGAVLLAAGLLLTSFTNSIPWLVASYGVLAGLGIGATTNAVAGVLSWFPDRRGLAAGVMTMGFGMGGLVLGSLLAGIIVLTGWRAAFRLAAALALLICLGAFLVLRRAPAGWAAGEPAGECPANVDQDRAPGEMLRTASFWLLVSWCLLVSTAGVMVIGHVVPMAVELGVDSAAAVVAMGTLSLANGLGRLIYGTLSDRLDRTPTMFLAAFLMAVAVLSTIPLTRAWGSTGLTAAVILIGSSYGAMVPLVNTLILQMFGPSHYGTNLGLSSFQIAVSGLLGPQLAGLLRSSTGSYQVPLSITGVLAAGACLAAILFGRALRRQDSNARPKNSARRE